MMRKLIEVSYEGELRTLIVEGDNRYSGPFFESIAMLVAENREGKKKWHCMHNKFHWDEGSVSRFSLLCLALAIIMLEGFRRLPMIKHPVMFAIAFMLGLTASTRPRRVAMSSGLNKMRL